MGLLCFIVIDLTNWVIKAFTYYNTMVLSFMVDLDLSFLL